MPSGALPLGAGSGLIDPDYSELPEVSGWLDDMNNVELQDLLFGSTIGIRFVPEVRMMLGIPTPCSIGTVAACIFANLGVDEEDRIGQILLAKAKRSSAAGLAYRQAIVDHHRRLIATMAPD